MFLQFVGASRAGLISLHRQFVLRWRCEPAWYRRPCSSFCRSRGFELCFQRSREFLDAPPDFTRIYGSKTQLQTLSRNPTVAVSA